MGLAPMHQLSSTGLEIQASCSKIDTGLSWSELPAAQLARRTQGTDSRRRREPKRRAQSAGAPQRREGQDSAQSPVAIAGTETIRHRTRARSLREVGPQIPDWTRPVLISGTSGCDRRHHRIRQAALARESQAHMPHAGKVRLKNIPGDDAPALVPGLPGNLGGTSASTGRLPGNYAPFVQREDAVLHEPESADGHSVA